MDNWKGLSSMNPSLIAQQHDIMFACTIGDIPFKEVATLTPHQLCTICVAPCHQGHGQQSAMCLPRNFHVIYATEWDYHIVSNHVIHVINLSRVCHVNGRSPMPGHQSTMSMPHQCSMLTNNYNYLKMCRCAHPTPTHPQISTPQIPTFAQSRMVYSHPLFLQNKMERFGDLGYYNIRSILCITFIYNVVYISIAL